jgi:hypothetical protein
VVAGLVVKLLTVTVVVPQPMEVSDPHEPEKTCTLTPEEVKLLPRLDRAIVALVDVATNLYQTSSSATPEHGVTATPLFVAQLTVSDVLATL